MSFLDPIFDPLLTLQPVWAILILSFFMSLVITIAYRLLTDQKKMREMKERMKKSQKQMREVQDSPKKIMAIQKEMMGMQGEYFKASLKPTIVTLIPVWLIFAWMSANMAFMPIAPGEVFSTSVVMEKGVSGNVTLNVTEGLMLIDPPTQEIRDGMARWELKGEEGTHTLQYEFKEELQAQEVLITNGFKYDPQLTIPKSQRFRELKINYEKVRPLGEISLFGWHPGWLGTYIIFSLVFSMALRRAMNLA